MMRPLEGKLVLDFSTLLPGPLASLMLAEAGAEVIKIERPDGEDMRRFPPAWGGSSAPFAVLNRGKQSIALDLKSPEDRARLLPLLARADILIEQFRPGVMARLGLGYEELSRVNPGLIYCSITGYGQTGPLADLPGHDLNYIAQTGLLSLSCGPVAAPVVPPALIADIAGGTFPAVTNILLALLARETTGKGCCLDIAMADTAFTFGFYALAQGFAAGAWPRSGDEHLTGGLARYRLYPAADGVAVAVGALEEKFWQTFCDLIGLEPNLRDDSVNQQATAARVAALLAQHPSGHWRALFAQHPCCVNVVETMQDAVNHPHFQARGLFAHQVTNSAGDVMPAAVVPIASVFRAAPDVPQAAPVLSAGEIPRHHGGTPD